MKQYQSWGRYPSTRAKAVQPLYWRDDVPDLSQYSQPVLPYGCGRSYGDVCLNGEGILLDTTSLNRFLAFDKESGLLRCEAGVTLADILENLVPQGWFLPVTPGTKYVTVGGAIANDVHGKNHHLEGTFGCHVPRFELLRSSGERLVCSKEENCELYRATIGGMGLTGLILWAEVKLKPIQNSYIDVEHIRFANIDEFLQLSVSSDRDYIYTVSWVDSVTRGKKLGRGVFMRGNHNQSIHRPKIAINNKLPGKVFLDAPSFFLNNLSMRVLNTAFYNIHFKKRIKKVVPYDPYFYPLDKIEGWNRLYGTRGFLQYQCVVPFTEKNEAIKELLERTSRSGQYSFVTVLKQFGHIKSPGMMSFPRPGITLALDFGNNGEKTLRLCNDLDEVVRQSGGAVYPAKDSRMSPESFRLYYPQWQEFARYLDPNFSSSFWRRVTGEF